MNVGRPLDDRLANDLVDEFDHGRLRIVRIQISARLAVLQNLECAARFQNFIESLRADAVKRLHRTQNLPARHEHPFCRFFQELRGELSAHRIKQIVSGQHHRIFLHLDRQNVVLKDEAARQDRQRRPVDLFGIDRDNWHMEGIPDGAEEALFVHFAGIKHLAHPRTAV